MMLYLEGILSMMIPSRMMLAADERFQPPSTINRTRILAVMV